MGRSRQIKQQRRAAVAALTSEQRAAQTVLEERNRRVNTCHAELVALLQRHGCGLSVDLLISMLPSSSALHGRYQLMVIPLDGSSLAAPIAAPASGSQLPQDRDNRARARLDPVTAGGKGALNGR